MLPGSRVEFARPELEAGQSVDVFVGPLTRRPNPAIAQRLCLPSRSDPHPPLRHLPLPPTPSILYPIPMPADRTKSLHFQRPTPSTAQLPKLRVQGLPCPPAVPGGCFICPSERPGAYLRRALGCFPVVSRGIRFVAAPRGSNPRSRNNLQAGPHLRWPDENTNPSYAVSCRDSTSIQPQSCTGDGEALPGTDELGKNAKNGTNRIEPTAPLRPSEACAANEHSTRS